jgi:hypothetical protein
MFLEEALSCLYHFDEIILIGKFDHFYHLCGVWYFLQYWQIVKVNIINYLFEGLVHDLAFKIYRDLLLLGHLLCLYAHVLHQNLAKDNAFTGYYAHVTLDLNVAASLLFWSPEFLDFMLWLIWFLTFCSIWVSLQVLQLRAGGRCLTTDAWGLVTIGVNSDILALQIDILTRNRPIAHIFIRITVLTAIQIIIAFIILIIQERLCSTCLIVIRLVKSSEHHISIKAINELFVQILHQWARLWLNDADIMNATAADFDDFSMHEAFHQLWDELHAIYFIIIGGVERRWWVQRWSTWHMGVQVVAIVGLFLLVISWRVFSRSIRISSTHKWILVSDDVWYFLKVDILKAISSFAFVFTQELSKLATSIGSKRVEMSCICQGKSMCFSTGYCHYLFVLEGDYFGWKGLIRLRICVFR